MWADLSRRLTSPVARALAPGLLSTPWLTTTLTAITNAFGPVILPLVVGIACAAWAKFSGAWRDPLLLASAMVMSTLIAMAVKSVVARPRPASDLQVIPGLETSYSFPSGHTSGAATLVLVTVYLLWRHRRGHARNGRGHVAVARPASSTR